MGSIKLYQLQQELKKGKLHQLYFFNGPEEFLQEQLAGEIIEKVVPAESREYNVDHIDAEDLTPERFKALSDGQTFFGSAKIIIVKDAEDVRDSAIDDISSFLETVPEDTHIIFRSSKFKFKGKKNLFGILQKRACCVIFWKMFPNSLESWVRDCARGMGYSIDEGAIAELTAESNESLRIIKTEIDKLAVYAGERKRIGVDDVRAVQGHSKDHSIFELERLYLKRDVKSGLKCIKKLSGIKYNDILMLNCIFRTLKKILFTKKFSDDPSYSRQDIAKILKLHKTHDKDIFEHAGRFRMDELMRGIKSIARAEERIKTGDGTALYVLSSLWIGICRGSLSEDAVI